VTSSGHSCPWHPAPSRPVCIAVDCALQLSEFGHFPPFDRSNCVQQTRAAAQSLAMTAQRDGSAPAHTRPRPDPRASGFINFPPRTRSPSGPIRSSLATALGTWCPPPTSIGLASKPRTLASSSRASGFLVPSYILPFSGGFSGYAVRATYLTCIDQPGVTSPPPPPCRVGLLSRFTAVFGR